MQQETKNICEPKTFEVVYKEYAKPLKRFIYFKSGNMDMAEDVMQDTFLKLWTNCKQAKYETVKNYLFTIANNIFLNFVKHQAVVNKHKSINPKISTNETPEFLLLEKEFQDKLEKAINGLTKRQKEVFLLNRIEKKKYKEIAIKLNISIKTVEKHMHDALKVLKTKIGKV